MTYRKLYIICEGKTEEYFVKNVLAEYLFTRGWIAMPMMLPTSRSGKGGWRRTGGYEYAVKEICEALKMNNYEVHTTFFDLYGFPSDIPCLGKAESMSSPLDKARLYENQLFSDVSSELCEGDSRMFVPYVQPYEFECFLFVDPKVSASELADGNEVRETHIESEIRKISQSFQSPEHINNSFETAPSKRLEAIRPGFVKNKAGRAGFSWRIAQRAGLDNIRKACTHFNEWLLKLEKL